MQFSWVLLLPLALASICPMEEHQICNAPEDGEEPTPHTCTCAVSPADGEPVPVASCNTLIQRDNVEEEEEDAFPAVSIDFTLSEDDGYDDFPEDQFKETIASSLRVDEDDVILFRVSCKGTNDSLTVQFGILKKDLNDSEIPYSEDDFLYAESVASRMKAMGHLSKIADLVVDEINYVTELTPIEFEPDNTELIVQGIMTAAGFFLMFVLGVYKCIRGKSYSDELQKA